MTPYIAAELPLLRSKIEKRVIVGWTHWCVDGYVTNFLSFISIGSYWFTHPKMSEKKYIWCYNRSPRGVLIERCAGKMLQIYKRTPVLKCDFNIKLQCNYIVIKHQCWWSQVCCIFTKHVFVRTPFEDCFCKQII